VEGIVKRARLFKLVYDTIYGGSCSHRKVGQPLGGKRRWKYKVKRFCAGVTHPRDDSLSVSNPTRALDTLSGYHRR